MTKKRVYEFDIVRCIAMYAVIIIHVTALALSFYQPGSIHSVLAVLVNRMLKFTTPVFIFLSGMMIFIKYKNKPLKVTAFAKDRFQRIVIPYAFFSLIYYLYSIRVTGNVFNLVTFGKHLLLATACYHLYFIAIIVQLYLLTPFFLALKEKIAPSIILFVSLIINLMSIEYLHFPYADRIFLKFLVPFMLGILYGDSLLQVLNNNRKWKKYIFSGILILGLIYSYKFYQSFYYGIASQALIFLWFFYVVSCIFALIIVAEKLKRIDLLKRMAVKGTNLSYYIYLVHPLIIIFSEKFMNAYNVESTTLRLLINIVVVIIGSTLVAAIIKNNNIREISKVQRKGVQEKST